MNTIANIDEAVQLLKSGDVVAIPTETVYGLAADASNPNAVLKIFELKKRPKNHPLIVHIANADQIKYWAAHIPNTAYQLTNIFWPGPLTIVLKKASQIDSTVTGGQDTIALRSPIHPITQKILKKFKGGLAAPSANRFGTISPTTAQHVHTTFGDKLPIVDGGACSVGIESTIIDLSSNKPQILRPGMITAEQIRTVLKQDIQLVHKASASRTHGMLASHYAPKTPTILVTSEKLLDIIRHKTCVVFAQQPQPKNTDHCHWIQMPEHATAYAQTLYHQMHAADALRYDYIIIEDVPNSPDWTAIHDRLQKAAHTIL